MIFKHNNIKKFLINYHRKLYLYKFNKYNYYFYNLLLKLYKYYKNNNYIVKNKKIIFENNLLYNINLYFINKRMFINKHSFKILLPNQFTLKINIWYYILYNKYIIYLSKYLYNLILKLNYINIKYPLLLLLVKFIIENRLNKIKNYNKNKYSYTLYKIKYKLINKKIKIIKIIEIINIQYISYILNNKLLKFFILLCNYDIFKNIKYIWLKSSKINLLYYNYSNIINNINLNEVNKFNILGLYSLYWQILRYGFNYEYYSYNINIYNILCTKNIINIYITIYYNIILLTKNILIIWYKIKKIILLNYINNKFYKYHKKFKINKYNKYLYKKYLLRILSNYVLKFKPIKESIYKNIKNYIVLIKKNLDYICNTYLFNIKYNKLYKNNFNILSIINNINIDVKINNNILVCKNILLFIFTKLIGKKFFLNWFKIINNINNLNIKIYYNINKKIGLISYNNYILNKNKSYNNYIKLYNCYNLKYIWKFEKSIIYNIYIIFINIYYKFIFLFNITINKS